MSATDVDAQLLDALRDRTGIASLEFDEPPSRMTGGFEALTYGFRIAPDPALPEPLAGPLILRLFSSQTTPDQSRREAAFQNSLSALGYPVPAVREQFDTGIEGRSFNVMDRVDGEPMLNQAGLDPSTIEKTITWFARIHARLHQVDAVPVIDAVAGAGDGEPVPFALLDLDRHGNGVTEVAVRSVYCNLPRVDHALHVVGHVRRHPELMERRSALPIVLPAERQLARRRVGRRRR